MWLGNVPATRRQGLETGVNYQTGQYLVYANYAMVDATYQFTGLLASRERVEAELLAEIDTLLAQHGGTTT